MAQPPLQPHRSVLHSELLDTFVWRVLTRLVLVLITGGAFVWSITRVLADPGALCVSVIFLGLLAGIVVVLIEDLRDVVSAWRALREAP